jgi:hypothetical protein
LADEFIRGILTAFFIDVKTLSSHLDNPPGVGYTGMPGRDGFGAANTNHWPASSGWQSFLPAGHTHTHAHCHPAPDQNTDTNLYTHPDGISLADRRPHWVRLPAPDFRTLVANRLGGVRISRLQRFGLAEGG